MQEHADAAAEAGDGHGGIPHHERRITLRILQRMASFVRGDAYGRHRMGFIHVRAQPQHFVPRVVMVTQKPLHRLDGDVLQSGRIQNVPCSGRAAERRADCARPQRKWIALSLGPTDPTRGLGQE